MKLPGVLIKQFPLLVLIVFIAFVVLKVWTSGYGLVDGFPMGVRLAGFHETLRGGQFPVRFLEPTNHAYGYPVTNFLYPLPFYLAEGFNLGGFSIFQSIQIVFLLGFLLGSFGMYLFVSQKFNSWAGTIAAIFYTIFPFHFYGVFIRGSLGEATALAAVPFVFFFTDEVIRSKKLNYLNLTLLSLSLAILAMSHNTMTFLFVPLVVGYWLVSTLTNKRKLFYRLLPAGLLGLLLAATFWIPALVEINFTRAPLVQVANYYDHFLTGKNFNEYLGFPTLLILLGSLVWFRKEKSLGYFATAALIAFWLSTQFSEVIWQTGILSMLVQFPWRLAAVMAFATSLTGGVVFSKNRLGIVMSLVIAVVFLLTAKPGEIPPQDDAVYVVNGDSSTIKDEYIPIWVKVDLFSQAPQLYQFISGEGKVVDVTSGQLEVTKDAVIQLNKVYYPGVVVKANGQEVTIDYQTNGLLRFSLPVGSYQVTRVFTETPLRQTANMVSLLGVLISLGLLYKWFRPHWKRRFVK